MAKNGEGDTGAAEAPGLFPYFETETQVSRGNYHPDPHFVLNRHYPGWELPPPWLYEPRQTETGPISGDRGETRRVQMGPGWDRELARDDGRPAQSYDLTFGYHTEGGWSENQMSGVHAAIANPQSYHYGFMESWGPETSIPRNAPLQAWDYGAQLPTDVHGVF